MIVWCGFAHACVFLSMDFIYCTSLRVDYTSCVCLMTVMSREYSSGSSLIVGTLKYLG